VNPAVDRDLELIRACQVPESDGFEEAFEALITALKRVR